MSERPKGYTYEVSIEQLRAFSALTYEQRFAWLESTRTFLVAAATPDTIARIKRLRRGESILGDAPLSEQASSPGVAPATGEHPAAEEPSAT